MVGPTIVETKTLDLLKNIQSELKKINTNTAKAIDAKGKKPPSKRRFSDFTPSMDKLEKSTIELNKTFTKAEKDLDKAATLFNKSLSDLTKDALNPSKKVVKEFNDALSDMVTNQLSDQQKLARNTQSYLRTNKNATSNIRTASNAFKDYIGVLKNVSKNHGKISGDDKKIYEDSRKMVSNILAPHKINLFNNLSKEQIKLLDSLKNSSKLTTAQLSKLAEVTEKINSNFKVVSDVTTQYSTNLKNSMSSLKDMLSTAAKSLMGNIAKAVGAAAPRIFSDLAAQTQNAVKTSSYLQIQKGSLGVSEAELSEFIGKNRLILRQLGGGRASGTINNGQLAKLQNQTRELTGLTGIDALKQIGFTFDSLTKMGGSAANAGSQMQSLYKTMQQTGMSFEDLNNMVGDLSQSPAFLDLIRANGYKGQANQIDVLAKILATSRYSSEYLKEMLDIDKQSKFQGIAEMVKGKIGARLVTNLMNRYGANISGADEGLLEARTQGYSTPEIVKMMQTGQFGKITQNGRQLKPEEMESYLLQLPQRFSEGRNNVVNNTRGLSRGLFNTQFGAYADLLGPYKGMFNVDESIKASAFRQGTFGTTNPTDVQKQLLLGANDDLVTSVRDVTNAFIPFGETLNSVVLRMKDILEGGYKNPAIGAGAQTASGIGGAAMDVLKLIGAGKAITTLGRYLPGGLGIGARALGGLGTAGGLLTTGAIGGTALMAGGNLLGGHYGAAGGNVLGGALGFMGGRALGALAGRLIGGALGSLTDVVTGPGGTIGGALLGGYLGGKLVDVFSGSPTAKTTPSAVIRDLNNNSITADTSVVPQGDTMGDLLSTNVDKLQELINIQRKQLSVLEDAHQEQMDYLKKRDNDDAIEDARHGTIDRMHGKH